MWDSNPYSCSQSKRVTITLHPLYFAVCPAVNRLSDLPCYILCSKEIPNEGVYQPNPLVLVMGLEPTRTKPEILSLICLPFHHTSILFWRRLGMQTQPFNKRCLLIYELYELTYCIKLWCSVGDLNPTIKRL